MCKQCSSLFIAYILFTVYSFSIIYLHWSGTYPLCSDIVTDFFMHTIQPKIEIFHWCASEMFWTVVHYLPRYNWETVLPLILKPLLIQHTLLIFTCISSSKLDKRYKFLRVEITYTQQELWQMFANNSLFCLTWRFVKSNKSRVLWTSLKVSLNAGQTLFQDCKMKYVIYNRGNTLE